ncbi:MAG TPA: hypothetical protein VFM68_00725 [Candidatus Saccharimonadales bacterium]|nr:hypothetical protein [Candidatus Saccharimonadales bacterium]
MKLFFAHNGHDHVKETLQIVQDNTIGVIVLSTVVVLLVGGGIFWYCKRQKNKK